MKCFKAAGQVHRFLSAHDQTNNVFHLRRDHVIASQFEQPGPRPSRPGPRSAAPRQGGPLPYSWSHQAVEPGHEALPDVAQRELPPRQSEGVGPDRASLREPAIKARGRGGE